MARKITCARVVRKIKRIAKYPFRLFKRSMQKPLCYIDLLNSKLFHSNDLITQHYTYKLAQPKKNLCIFSHYDPHNQIDPHVEYYLRELAKSDCEIIFVTTSSDLNESERHKISSYCRKIIIKQNRGRDFGAFKCGILAVKNLEIYDKVIFANDSVYGPFYDLKKLINFGDTEKLNMWGSTDSWEKKYHIQSYFVVFDKSIIRDPRFFQYWMNVAYVKSRQSTVEFYEIGMSQFFLTKGFKLGALCDYAKIKKDLEESKNNKYKNLFAKTEFCNSTHYFWDDLIESYEFPFIKRELLLKNPMKIKITHWPELIRQHTPFDTKLISNNLIRVNKAL